MTDESRRVPIKVKVVDKRKTNARSGVESENPSEGSRGVGADEGAPSAPLRDTVFNPALRKDAPSSDEGGVSSERDESGSAALDPLLGAGLAPGSEFDEELGSSSAPDVGGADDGADYLDDLRRLQAEFDNFRKRTFRERQQLEARGKRRLIERLLPVLDNFELAVAHGEGGPGVELVFKELKSSLETEGLAGIPAEGEPFDPQVHDAVESIEDAEVEHATVTKVYRRGYRFGDDVVRPAMVAVARPAEAAVAGDDEDDDVEEDAAEVAEGSG
jgi:molecular chaperone GrpE